MAGLSVWFATTARRSRSTACCRSILEKLSGCEGTVRIHTEIGGIEEERIIRASARPAQVAGVNKGI